MNTSRSMEKLFFFKQKQNYVLDYSEHITGLKRYTPDYLTFFYFIHTLMILTKPRNTPDVLEIYKDHI
jgi:hypothetical protein